MQSDEILAHLTDMFGDYIELGRIQTTMRRFNNDLEACIEALLTDQEKCGTEVQLCQTEQVGFPTSVAESNTQTATGAIKKSLPQTVNSGQCQNFASFLQKGNQSFGIVSQTQSVPKHANRRSDQCPPNFGSTVERINQGYRVMVLMRGAPGSGKSYLSRVLIDKTLRNGDYRNHIFSADDYFLVNGVYRYRADRIEDAHRYNHNNVRAKARDGWSPIVVDNTNIKLWEMYAYVSIAAEYGYHLEVMEPVTHWKNNAKRLAAKNIHEVPEHKIKVILGNYEILKNTAELYKLCNLHHVLEFPPKMRHFPIVKEDLLHEESVKNIVHKEDNDNTGTTNFGQWIPWSSMQPNEGQLSTQNIATESENQMDKPIPKPPRQTPKHMFAATACKSVSTIENQNEVLAVESISLNGESEESEWRWPSDVEASWEPYNEESAKFWSKSNTNEKVLESATFAEQTPRHKRSEKMPIPDKSNFSLSNVSIPAEWRTPENSVGVTPVKQNNKKKSDNQRIELVKHRRGCKNENTSFSEICNLYPQIPAQYLWDLFEKCDGDGDWTANLLIEEQKMYDFEQDKPESDKAAEDGHLDCDCNEPQPLQVLSSGNTGGTGVECETDRFAVSSGSPRNTNRKKDKMLSGDLQQAKKQLEAFVVLGKEHYSDHIQQIRAAKGIISKEEANRNSVENGIVSTEEQREPVPEVLEVTLGLDLIRQLHEIFKSKHALKSFSVDELTKEQTKVFVSTEMAEQLYLAFMDTMYSLSEEKKLCTIKKDAQVAQQLETQQRYPVLFKQPSNNIDAPDLNDIIEMENALKAYRNEINGWIKQVPQDLASQMTRQKLAEMFPTVEHSVLTEILHAHDNKFHDTVKVLNNSIPEQLRDQVAREREALLKRTETEKHKPTSALITLTTDNFIEQDTSGRITGEDAINLHLKTAEECRNLAQHHQELKNECHEKARNAIQRGMAGVAEYYAQIARLHRTKIDMYNSRASNAIMEVHKLTLNNADVLDLHYLHSEEALRCLEIFLAEQAGRLRSRQQQYKELFIITGRGLHSADGIPIIKHRVKAMLRDLGLRCVELNPGFLKIKLYNNADMLERLMVSNG
ncbi:NEDD4-binding protein 2 [Malaya genurostris]|uniref:NEDD4-binding protein 2 n=1 Tax=Malaya genurostris TaxID=325434 RepID=UPI0026F3C1ED|nr:NEDD4-binding protein 2 [Malaya genurostris]